MVKDILKLKYVLSGNKSSLQTIINIIGHSTQSTPESQNGKGHEWDEQQNYIIYSRLSKYWNYYGVISINY